MDETELKKAFALAWLKEPSADPFKAATSIVGSGDPGRLLVMSNNWVVDPIVLDEKAALLAKHGPRFFIPSKEELAREVYELAKASRVTEDRLKAYRLFGDIMGYIEKPTTNIQTNVAVVNRVMVVNEQGSDADWEKKLMQQQDKLAHAATQH